VVPILENTDGTLIPESGIIADFAIEAGKDQGIQLIPSDPFEAAKMRVKMDKGGKAFGPFLMAYFKRFKDQERNEKFVNEILPVWE
jgi:glutathione S-transferase